MEISRATELGVIALKSYQIMIDNVTNAVYEFYGEERADKEMEELLNNGFYTVREKIEELINNSIWENLATRSHDINKI